jgi:hypothetical protein
VKVVNDVHQIARLEKAELVEHELTTFMQGGKQKSKVAKIVAAGETKPKPIS